MGWETRKGNSYYYRKERDGERVVSEYVGRAEWVSFIADIEMARREEREMKRAIEREKIARLEAEDREADEISEMVEAVTACTLLVSGYHCHRGTWRRKRNGQNSRCGS